MEIMGVIEVGKEFGVGMGDGVYVGVEWGGDVVVGGVEEEVFRGGVDVLGNGVMELLRR